MSNSVAGISLQEGETVHHSFRPAWGAWFWPIVLTFGLWIPIVWWNRRKVRYIVTDNRVIRKRGRVGSSVEQIRIADVSRVVTNRSLGERILGGGSMMLDTGPDEMTLTAVPNHSTVSDTIGRLQAK